MTRVSEPITSSQHMNIVVHADGTTQCIYSEILDLTTIGHIQISRASHVEPDEEGQWWTDLSPMLGPKLGPFVRRSSALDAEVSWLENLLVSRC